MTENKLGLYIHIPICKSKCKYCDFCSYVCPDNETVGRYIEKLCEEASEYRDRCKNHVVDTVYFGGGTPTLLNTGNFARIIDAVRKNFNLSSNPEISAECNPATADGEYLKKLRELGVNRLSIGMQSANRDELITLGRRHDFGDFLKTLENASSAGFDDISADIMYGIPGQTEESFGETLSETVKLPLTHISVYALKLEKGTYFYKNRENYEFPDGDMQYNMYVNAVKTLAEAGFLRYEISNFAKDGKVSRHNLKYWTGGEYIGLGVSAYSYFGGERYNHGRNIYAYNDGRDKCGEHELIGADEKRREYIMLRLRLESGIDLTEYKIKFGSGFTDVYKDRTDKYIKGKFAVCDGKKYALTTDGMMISNMILSELLYG